MQINTLVKEAVIVLNVGKILHKRKYKANIFKTEKKKTKASSCQAVWKNPAFRPLKCLARWLHAILK